jgi:hypothetical protein
LAIEAELELLSFIGWVEINDNTVLPVISKYVEKLNENEKGLKKFVIESIISSLIREKLLAEFFPYGCVEYDIDNEIISIRNHMIPLEYSGLRNLLYELNLFQKNRSPSLININPEFSNYFIDQIIENIRRTTLENISSSSFDYDQLMRLNEIKRIYGEDAEKLVYKYEMARLIDHPQKEKIKIISGIDVGAGYDIISFNDNQSKEFDRFIEVKSHSGNMKFYWSLNEVNVAKQKQNHYFLYLIDRSNLENERYLRIIENPYQEVFLDDGWLKQSDSWIIKPN